MNNSCRNCSTPLPPEAAFCPECGAVVKRKDGKAASLIKALLCGAGYIAIQYVCALLLFLLLGVVCAVLRDTSAAELFSDIATIVSGAAAFVCAMLIFAVTGKKPTKELSMRAFPPRLLPLCALLGVTLQFVLSFVTALVPWPREILLQHTESTTALLSGNIVLTVLSSAVVAGIVEEVIFRALIIGRLTPAFGSKACIVVSAVIFGAAHMSPVAFFYATLLGVILGAMLLRYRSVWMCATVHICFNLTAILAGSVSSPLLYIALVLISGALALILLYLIFKRPHDGEL